MITKIGLPAVAVALIVFAVNFLMTSYKAIPQTPPPIQPARNPFDKSVAGAGIIEPETENISVGAPAAGIVVEVMAKVDQRVIKGDPLFRLDDRQLKAELAVRQAMLADARAAVVRLEQLPRKEELPPAQASMEEAEADYVNWKQKWERTADITNKGAMSSEEIFERKQKALQALARYQRADADFKLLRAGAWQYDKDVAQSSVERAEAEVAQAKEELDRLIVRALVDGEVLQVNVRPGEFVSSMQSEALVVLGNVKQLHVRVDIDEYDIPRFDPNAPAEATLKGQPKTKFPLRLVRVEPFVVPKKSLTGDNTERVDTRVLQVIYAIDTQGQRLFVGQQVDAFINVGGSKEDSKQAEAAKLIGSN